MSAPLRIEDVAETFAAFRAGTLDFNPAHLGRRWLAENPDGELEDRIGVAVLTHVAEHPEANDEVLGPEKYGTIAGLAGCAEDEVRRSAEAMTLRRDGRISADEPVPIIEGDRRRKIADA